MPISIGLVRLTGCQFSGESIADHSYRMALISMFAPPSLDIPKCIKMSLIHDLAESLVGDITPADGVPKPEKNRREEITMDYLTGEILGRVAAGIIGNDILALWKEHEEGKTMESKFVQDVDKVELLIQMMDYERRGNGGLNLSEFTYVATKLHLPETKGWAEEILKSRDEFWSGKGVAYKGEDSVSHQVRKMQDQYYSGTEQGDANVYPEGALSLNQE